MRVLHGLLPPSPLDRRAPTANTDGTSSVGRDGARGRRDGGGREAAGGVHLLPPRFVLRELPPVFRKLLRRVPARVRLLPFLVSAVRRSAALPDFGLDGPVGAAQQQLRDGCGMAFAAVQRRHPARPTAAATRPAHSADSPRAQTAHPQRFWPSTSASASTSDPMIRRLPQAAAQFSVVKPSLCTAGPGCGGGPHGGTPVPNRYPKHKTAGSPRGSTTCSFWVTVNDREYSRGLGAVAVSHPARASIERGKLEKVAGTAIAGEGGGEHF